VTINSVASNLNTMPAKTFDDSLILQTSPGPWSQIILLSQDTINRAFKNIYDVAKAKDRMSTPLCHIDLNSLGGTLHADLDASEVLVNVVDFNCMLYFQWKIRSGTMALRISDDPDDQTFKTFNIDRWTMAFRTSLSKTYTFHENQI
jgi:hypothetical protein